MTTIPVTAPPPSRLRRFARSIIYPLLSRAARAYVAGDSVADALRVARRFARSGLPCTVGYFDSEEDDTPQSVLRAYLQTISALAGSDNYISIKLPALGFSQPLLARLALAAAQAGIRLHFDALWPESADQTRSAIDALLCASPVVPLLGYTLPSRWVRSLEDADWAGQRPLFVRVVKGQWPDPSAPERDLRRSYLQVVDRLAGRARHVALATHDVPLARQALNRLRRAETSCELELLFGLPLRPSLQLARKLQVPVRLYIPFGRAHLPYALAKLRANPHLLLWLLKDLLALP